MEITKKPKIKSIPYEEFIDNESLEKLVRELNAGGYIKGDDLLVVTAGVLNYRTGEKATDTNIMRVIKADGSL